MKKFLFIALTLCMSLALFANGGAEKETEKLEFAVKETGSTLEAYQKIVDAFNAEGKGIEVEIVSYGKDYASLMKAKMAANDLPDLFTTHGWSVFLYGKYLAPLNNRTWANDISPEIVGTVTDLSGNIVSLPMDIDITGMIVNTNVLKASGVEKVPDNLFEFLDACAKIKAEGLTPIYVGGKDSSDTAGLFSRLSLILFTTSKTRNYASALHDGTFDWTNYDQIAELVNDMVENGYFNVDYLTADKAGGYRALAENQVAFTFQSNQTIAEVKKINADAAVKMMKLPGLTAEDDAFLISGERDAVGAWKDGENLESALVFIDYLAKPENVKLVSEAYELPPSMVTVTDVKPAIADLLTVINGCYVSNHFDREYLPDGMWNVLKAYSSSILSKEMGIREGSEYMSAEYKRLKK